jgi:hypothetical protein
MHRMVCEVQNSNLCTLKYSHKKMGSKKHMPDVVLPDTQICIGWCVKVFPLQMKENHLNILFVHILSLYR